MDCNLSVLGGPTYKCDTLLKVVEILKIYWINMCIKWVVYSKQNSVTKKKVQKQSFVEIVSELVNNLRLTGWCANTKGDCLWF